MASGTDILSSNNSLIQSKANAAAAAATSSASTSKTSAAASATKLSGDIDFFLKMLTTQLKNQDPTAPMDVAQMTQQIAQYSGVEQQVKTNSNLEKLLNTNQQSQLSTAVSYISKEVESVGNTGSVLGGQGAFSYLLPKTAGKVDITITNANGAAVFQGAGDTKAGRNLIVWDGKNSFNGKQEADGTYTLTVKAQDTSGNTMTAETRAVGIVTGVENDKSGNITLQLGDKSITYSDVMAVREPTRANLSATTDSGTNNAS